MNRALAIAAVTLSCLSASKAQAQACTTGTTDERLACVTDQMAALNVYVSQLQAVVAVNGSGDVVFTNTNVYVRSGSGATNGAVNGKGNLIVGYGETDGTQIRSGSHNLVVGTYNSYGSFGALVAGFHNTSSAPFASVDGGRHNTAGALLSTVAGGQDNVARSKYSTIVGGRHGRDIGERTTTVGSTLSIDDTNQAAYFDGANVYVRSGSGATDGPVNGLGNLIVGYGEDGIDTRTGSHNLVVGPYHTYTSYGGVLLGFDNVASAPYAATIGGSSNEAGADESVVIGGSGDVASGIGAVAIGGNDNTALGGGSVAISGEENKAEGTAAVTLGGQANVADGADSVADGGHANVVSGTFALVAGGHDLVSASDESTVTGGADIAELATESFVIGQAYATQSYVTGQGFATTAYVDDAAPQGLSDYVDVDTVNDTVKFVGANVYVQSGSGATDGPVNGLGNLIIGYNEVDNGESLDRSGSNNLVVGTRNAWSSYGGVVFGTTNAISGQYASVTGGGHNEAAMYGAVTGGAYNVATGNLAMITGGFDNAASGEFVVVVGGTRNLASGLMSVVTGGADNTASAGYDLVP